MNTSYASSPLHAHFHHRNIRAFRQVLEASRSAANPVTIPNGGSAPGPSRSWQGSFGQAQVDAHFGASPVNEIANGRDRLGRAVLHLVCSATDSGAHVFLQALLAHPLINVNIQDTESGWTPLHRALWVGNIAAAVLLVSRRDLNLHVKDHEGYTAFDLYNSTVEGTIPDPLVSPKLGMDLFLWNQNRNSTGLGDGVRSYPDRLDLERHQLEPDKPIGPSRFHPVRFNDVALTRLRSAVVTNEAKGNLRAYGHQGAIRSGSSFQHHTQNFTPVQHASRLKVIAVAVAQDHTLALVEPGEVYSWGFNRFNQLGYTLETAKNLPGHDDALQTTARKVSGALQKEVVKGVTACKVASACWTDTDVYTWGMNRGYSKVAQPVQILPRKVTPVTHPVVSAAISDSALCILLASRNIICFAHDTHFTVLLPSQQSLSELSLSYPSLRAVGKYYTTVEKITACDETFAMVTQAGDVFTWNISAGDTSGSTPATFHHAGAAVRPQRVWIATRKLHSAKDVALGADGTILVCTESGHAFLHSRAVRSAIVGAANATTQHSLLPLSFHRVRSISRVVKVAASPLGTLAAMTVEVVPKEIPLSGASLQEDVSGLLSVFRKVLKEGQDVDDSPVLEEEEAVSEDDAGDFAGVSRDAAFIKRGCAAIMNGRLHTRLAHLPYARRAGELADLALALSDRGADVLVCSQPFEIPAHACILAARSEVLRRVLKGAKVTTGQIGVSLIAPLLQSGGTVPDSLPVGRLHIEGCHPLTTLLLLQYLYTDDVAAIWDRLVWFITDATLQAAGTSPVAVKSQLITLAHLLGLPRLARAAENGFKAAIPTSLQADLVKMYERAQESPEPVSVGGPDVVLEIADRSVRCHSAILRVRSSYFSTLFDDPDWTVSRRTNDGILVLNMRHLEWNVVGHVLRFMCCGEGEEMFDDIDHLHNAEDLIEHAFSVLAAANELLLDQLILICSRVIMRHVSVNNVCSLLRDAILFSATHLIQSLQHYIGLNLEFMLYRGLLSDYPPEALKDLSTFIRAEQFKKHPTARSNKIVNDVTTKWADWLALQDIPSPFYTRPSKSLIKMSPKLSPVDNVTTTKVVPTPSVAEPVLVSLITPNRSTHDAAQSLEGIAVLSPTVDTRLTPPVSTSPTAAWKGKGVVRSAEIHDLRTIMESQQCNLENPPSSPKVRIVGFHPSESPSSPKWTPKMSLRERRRSQQSFELMPATPEHESAALPTPSPKGSPWKVVPKTTISINEINMQAKLTVSTPMSVGKPVASPSGLSRAMSAHKAPSTDTTAPATPSKPGQSTLGPTITPVRASSFGNISVTRTASGDAWTQPAQQPKNTPRSRPAASGAQIFNDPEPSLTKETKKSLREIQEEEQALRIQADFERWWAQEEARVKAEEERQLAAAKAASRNPSGGYKRGKGGKPKKKSTKKAENAGTAATAGSPKAEKRSPATTAPSTAHATPAIPIVKPASGQVNAQTRGGRTRRK